MKRIIFAFLLMTSYASASFFDDVKHACMFDIGGINGKNNLSFCNQVVSEILSSEQLSKKQRITETVCGSGNSIYTVDWISSSSGQFDENLTLYLSRELEYVKDEKELGKNNSFKFFFSEYEKRNDKSYRNNMTFDTFDNDQNDFIYIATAKSAKNDSKLKFMEIGRDIQIGKWRCVVSYITTKEVSEEMKNEWISKLQNCPSLNYWIQCNK